MENSKRAALIVFCLVLLAGCGGNTNKSASDEITPRDARTGKTYKDTNSMLEAVKEQRPQEYQVIYDVIKDNDTAKKSFELYNSQTTDQFPETTYVGFDGSQIDKEKFDQELANLKMNSSYSDVLPKYYQKIEAGFYDEAFKMIKPQSLFSQLFGNRIDVFANVNKQSRFTVRVSDFIPLEYKLVDEGGMKFVQVAYKTMGFWISSPLKNNPDEIQKQIQDSKSAEKQPTQLKDGSKPEISPQGPPPDWQYHASGKTIMRLIFDNGSWLIYAQI